MSAFVQLSVVIPTFNTAEMTLACCRAALASVAARSEVIVVDDASTDQTTELLASELPQVRVIRLERNRGFSAAANAGVNATTGTHVLLLNSDAIVTAGAVGALLSAFEDPRVGIAGARLLDPDGSPQWSGGAIPTLPWLTVMAGGFAKYLPRRRRGTKVGRTGWVSGAAMAFRRETWNDAGPLREHYRFYAQDLDFCARAGKSGWDVVIVEEARVLHIAGATVRVSRKTGDLPHDPALLWSDLLTWAGEHHGTGWATAARILMSAAGIARLTGRRLRELTLSGDSLRRSREATGKYREAVRSLFRDRQ